MVVKAPAQDPFAAIARSVRPPTWRGDETVFTYCLTQGECGRLDYIDVCRYAEALGVPNPRVLTPGMVSWASVLQPAFFAAASRWAEAPPLAFTPSYPPADQVGATAHWIGSTVFLAGVTLSAAIIQTRFSGGTLVSKLDRLWHAASAAEAADLDILRDLRLAARVVSLGSRLGENAIDLLIDLKAIYADVVAALAPEAPTEWDLMKAADLDPPLARRFGFRESLVEALGDDVVCIVVYGSSVTSEVFADYDLIVVVRDRNAALRALAGVAPRFGGIELNISLFDEAEFDAYQALSGDNLSHHGLCLWGEIETPHKARPKLLHRNFSFGYVRMRQIIGMRFPARGAPGAAGDDRSNLHGYFAKIPLNVARGLRGSLGQTVTKEGLVQWARQSLDYETPARPPADGDWRDTMASAAWATQATLTEFNGDHCVYACDA